MTLSTDSIEVEVVFAQPERQWLRTIRVPANATVDDAIRMSKIQTDCPDVDLAALQVGIWGHPASRHQVVTAGQRIEVYRGLLLDPREARRQLALAGQTMNQTSGEADEG